MRARSASETSKRHGASHGVCRSAGLVAAVLVALLCPSRPAFACGVWSVTDAARSWLVVFRSLAIEIVHHPGRRPEGRTLVDLARTKQPSRDRDWLVMRSGPRPHEWRFGRKVLSLRRGTVHLDGKKVGVLTRSEIRLGDVAFKVVFGENHVAPGPYSMIPDGAGRGVKVIRDGHVVLEGAASGPPHCEENPIHLLAVYLAWRELLLPVAPSTRATPR
jgi:hypothetical protein